MPFRLQLCLAISSSSTTSANWRELCMTTLSAFRGDENVIYCGNGMDNPFAAEGSRKVEQYDIKDGILLFDVAVQVFYRFLRIAF